MQDSAAAHVWHAIAAEAAIGALGADPLRGLDESEAAARRAQDGPNELPEANRRSLARIAFDQFNDFMILVLAAAAVVSGLVGGPQDAIAVVVIILINAVIGFFQEVRAENAIAALKAMAAPNALVRRNGETRAIPASDLVRGDIVIIEAGAVAPADLRLIETAGLACAEAALTGEAATVLKDAAAIVEPSAPLGERSTMALRGVSIVAGRGVGVVVATGAGTELGRIARLLQDRGEQRSPLQRRLAAFGQRLALLVAAICAILFVTGVLRGEDPTTMLLTSVSLAVAAIPEALPAVTSIALALGAMRMALQKALIRRLSAVEALGSITYICTDKTGTLTENRMRVVETWTPDGGAPAADFWRALALCNDARITPAGVIGDPTETALLEAAAAHGCDKAGRERAAPRIAELPFTSERRRMTTLHADDLGHFAVTKGALEALVGRLSGWAGPSPFDAAVILAEAERRAERGLRVMAVAQRRFPQRPHDLDAFESKLEFLGLVALEDPPRAGALEAIAECRSAGIRPVMITGDHAGTARAIAARIGILEDRDGEVMSGRELAALSDADLAARVEHVRVFARVDPAQKIRIVEALQARGHFVAMTGDGVNDAPALRRAEVGVAMGRDGSDVAREAAHLVLTDDNFATIVRAVREGRRIYDNIRKFIRYTMTSNGGEIWTIFLAPLVGLPIPLLPIHILWINLVTDGLPGLALTRERADPDIMRRPPRPPQESVFAHGLALHVLWVGLLMAGVCLAVQAFAIQSGSPRWQTMVFAVLTFSQLGHCLAVRSERQTLWRLGFATNPTLMWTVIGTILLQLATIYAPPLQPIFHTEPLTAAELALCLVASLVVFAAVEIEKLWAGRPRAAPPPAPPAHAGPAPNA